MALVKKFKGGGSFTDYLKQELHRDSHASNVSFDELIKESETYAPDDEGTEVSNSRQRRQRRNSNKELLNQYYKKYQDNQSNKVTTEFTPTNDYSVTDLSDYISKQYGGNAQYAHEQLRKLYGEESNPSNEGIKNKLREYMTELSADYINKSAADPSGKWNKLEEVKALKELTSNGQPLDDDTWAKIVGMSTGIGWDVTPYLLSDGDMENLKTINAAKKEEEAVKAKEQEASDFYSSLNITDEDLLAQLKAGGLNKLYDGAPKEFTDQGYNILENKAGERYVFKDGKIVTDELAGLITRDQFDVDNYGDIYRVSGGKYSRERYNPNTQYNNLVLDFDDLGSNRYGLNGNIGDNYNSDIIGSSVARDRSIATDIFGRRDYTASLDIMDPDSGGRIKLYKQPNGRYMTEDGTMYNRSVVLRSLKNNLGADNELSTDYTNLDGWKNIESRKNNHPYEKLDSTVNKFADIVAKAETNNSKLNINANDIKTTMGHIKYYMDSAKTQDELKRWANLWTKMDNIINTVDEEGNILYKIFGFKQGGVIEIQKFQQGTTKGGILGDSYASRRNSTPSETKSKGVSKINDTRGTMRDLDALGAISLAGTAISFIPGVGVIGGAASTVADAIKGAQDGWDGEDWGNLASNIAFTGLSFFGLGGAKALAKGAQAASKVAKVAKAGKTANQAKKTSKILDSLGDAGKALKDLPFSASSNWATRTGQFAKGVAKKASPMVGKTIKTGAAIGTYGGGVLGAKELGSNIAEDGLIEGFLNTDQSSIRRITQAGALGRSHAVNHLNAKAVDKFTELKGAKASTFKFNDGDKTRTFEGKQADKLQELLGKKKFGTGKDFKSKLTRGYSDDTLDQASKIMGGDDQNTVKAVREALNNLKKSGNISYTPTSGGTQVLTTDPKISSDRDMRDYVRAVKTTRRENANYSRWGYRKMREESPKADPSANKPASSTSPKPKETPKKAPKKSPKKDVKTVKPTTPVKPKKNTTKKPTTKKGQDMTNQGTLDFKQGGGILKLRQGTTSLGFTNPYLAKKDPRNSSYTMKDTSLAMKRYSPKLVPMKFDPINLRGTNSQTVNTLPNPGSVTVDNTNPINWNPKRYKDIYPFAETLKSAAVNQANSRITDTQIKGVSQIAKRSYSPYQNFRKNLDASVLAEKQASELASGAGRLGRTTSDINQRLGIQLEGVRQASDVKLAGRMQDIDRNRQMDDMQRQSDAQTQQYNLGIDDQNRATAANARRETYGLIANKHTMDINNLQNYISTLSNYAEQRPERKLRHDYLEALNNPNISKAEGLLSGSTAEKQKFMDEYTNYYDNLQDYQNKPTFEDSDYGRRWKLREAEIADFYKNTMAAVDRYKSASSIFNPAPDKKKKGGRLTVEERKYLKDVDHEHKRKIKDQELFFKTILENNKLAQKALIKVFK